MPKGRLLDSSRPARSRVARSRDQEKRTAVRESGHLVPASGSRWHAKGDVHVNKWMIDNKRTEAKQYILHLSEWKRHVLLALRAGMEPAFEVELLGGEATVVVMDLQTARRLGYGKPHG